MQINSYQQPPSHNLETSGNSRGSRTCFIVPNVPVGAAFSGNTRLGTNTSQTPTSTLGYRQATNRRGTSILHTCNTHRLPAITTCFNLNLKPPAWVANDIRRMTQPTMRSIAFRTNLTTRVHIGMPHDVAKHPSISVAYEVSHRRLFEEVSPRLISAPSHPDIRPMSRRPLSQKKKIAR